MEVPETAPDQISSTVVLKSRARRKWITPPIAQESDGTVHLLASKAELHGGLQYQTSAGTGNIGYWTNPEDTADWTFKIDRPGKFKLSVEIAAENSGKFQVMVGGQTLEATAPATGDYTKFQLLNLGGELELASPGTFKLTVKPIATGWQPMNLHSITLELVE